MPKVEESELGPSKEYRFVPQKWIDTYLECEGATRPYAVVPPGPVYDEVKAMLQSLCDDHHRKMREAMTRDHRSFWRDIWQSTADKVWTVDRPILVLVQK